MDRRSFLAGTLASLLPSAALADPLPRLGAGDLRGSIEAVPAGFAEPSSLDRSRDLQKALDRAAADGKPVFLPPGRYDVSNLRLPGGTRLSGVPGRTRLVYGGGGHLLVADGGPGIAIDGIVLDGANRALAEDVTALLHLRSVDGLVLDRVEIVGSAANAVSLEGCAGRIAGCTLSGARGAALWSVGARGLSVVDNLVEDCGDGGILIHRWEAGEDGTIVSRNRVRRIAARSGGTGQYGNGINVFRAGNVTISGNHVSDCAFSAIRSNAGSEVQIVGNQCLRSGETAVYSEFGFEGAVIADNMIDGGSIGISVANFDHGGRMAAVSGNVVRNLHNGAPYPDEMGLDFGIGISVEADTAVTGNVVEKAPTLGLMVGWGPFARNVVATGNVIRSARVGIGVTVVDGAGSITIASNVIDDVADGAIRGMRWADFVTPDLAVADAVAYPHVAIGGNRLS
jgi:uncharacterized secreted repeat protein (TIGR03808 family)